jgi:PAS domain S-box-containing protein
MSSDAHVLVLDDDEGILLLAARALRRVGYRVSACSTVQQALDCIGEPLPDLLVLDYRLGTPQTGLDFFRGLVARGIKLPAILATGFSDESRIIEALRAGVSDVVPKAADYLDYLPEAVERALNEAQMRRVVAESERMRDRERHYRTIAEALPHLVWTCTPGGECDFLSRQWSDYTGMPAGAELGAGWFDAVHVDDLPMLRDAWRQTVGRGADSFIREVRLRRHDGVYRWFCLRGTALREADGRIAKWFGTCTDIQDQREASDERERLLQSEQAARQAAEEANRAKDRFLAMLSHELRTPLTPVLASARMLERARDVPEPVRSAMKIIRRNIELEARLIDDLLDLTRVANGKLLLALETVDVHELIDAVLEIFRSDIQVKQLRVELDCTAQHRFVRADRARLQQMLWNLIKNAAKFTPEHGRIVLRTRDAEMPSETGAPQIQIDVQDSGIGIAPEQLGRLFNAFEQGGRHTTQQYGGLGLGLAITKALTDVHGGTVHAASEGLGRGATFTIVLPSVEAPGPVMERGTIAAAPQRATLDILLVEDHQDTADVMAQLIAGFGHNVIATGTVASALQAARQRHFDLVVSDIGLPDGTGLDLITALRGIETGAHVPAVALTGYGSDDDVRRCLEAGFMSHLTKPVNFTLLEGLIEEIAMAKGSGDALSTPTT